tara:strand:- start:660 stop:815 length:156 start_codon:yes stop_codon:yes gene_type:complete
MNPSEYKKSLGKSIKEMTPDEKRIYTNYRVRKHRENKKKQGYIKYARTIII